MSAGEKRGAWAEVLAALTEWPAARWRAVAASGCCVALNERVHSGHCVDVTNHWPNYAATLPLLYQTPVEAWEMLAARGLVPFAWLDEPARRFYDAGDLTCSCGAAWRHHGPSPAHLLSAVDAPRDHYTEVPSGFAALLAIAARATDVASLEPLAREAMGARVVAWEVRTTYRPAWSPVAVDDRAVRDLGAALDAADVRFCALDGDCVRLAMAPVLETAP